MQNFDRLFEVHRYKLKNLRNFTLPFLMTFFSTQGDIWELKLLQERGKPPTVVLSIILFVLSFNRFVIVLTDIILIKYLLYLFINNCCEYFFNLLYYVLITILVYKSLQFSTDLIWFDYLTKHMSRWFNSLVLFSINITFSLFLLYTFSSLDTLKMKKLKNKTLLV